MDPELHAAREMMGRNVRGRTTDRPRLHGSRIPRSSDVLSGQASSAWELHGALVGQFDRLGEM